MTNFKQGKKIKANDDQRHHVFFCVERSPKVWRVNKKTQLPVLWIEDQQSQRGEELNDTSNTCTYGIEYFGIRSVFGIITQYLRKCSCEPFICWCHPPSPFFLYQTFTFTSRKFCCHFFILTFCSFLLLI